MKALVKLESVQVARGIAALFVVIFHAKLILIRFEPGSYLKLPFVYDYGDFGVPLFFVISGFIIALVVQRQSFSISSFIKKRFWRLWPLYVFCTLAYITIYLLQRDLPPSEVGTTFVSVGQSLIFWPQIDYPALQPGWSLEHEVIFYIYAALIAGLFGFRTFFLFMGVITIFSLWHWNFGGAVWDWHMADPVNGYFFCGMCLHQIWALKPPSRGAIATCIGASLIIGGMYISSIGVDDIQLETFKLLVVGPGSAIFLYGLLGLNGTGWVWRQFVWLGDRSYSLYLVHFSFVPIFQTIHRDVIKWPEWMAEPLLVLFIVVSIAISAIVYELIEKPSALIASNRKAITG